MTEEEISADVVCVIESNLLRANGMECFILNSNSWFVGTLTNSF